MRSTQLSLEQYESDKVAQGYLTQYDPILEPWVNKEVSLLEIGVNKGGSVMMWRDYFPLGTIAGIDIKLPKNFPPTERIHLFEGSQADTKFLSRVANEIAPDGFDIIIDDASHMGELTKISFWHLFEHHLKPNGLYVIEDWGTGYWDGWRDGKSLDLQSYFRSSFRTKLLWLKIAYTFRLKSPMPCHSYGLVGFIKQLMDEQGAADVTKQNWNGTPQRQSKFQSMIITPAIVFIKKAEHQP